MANQNFRVKNGLEVGTGVTISGGIVTATTFSGSVTSAIYSASAGVATYSSISGISTSVIGGIASVTQLQVSGVATFQSDVKLGDSDSVYFGDNNNLRIFNDGSNSYILEQGIGNLAILGDSEVWIGNTAASEYKARFITDGAVELYYENVKKFETTGYGATVFGTLQSQGLQVSGISTLGNTIVGGGTTQLIVNGDARITGILTIGTSSITLDGSINQIKVGAGVTIHHTNGVQVAGNTLNSTGLNLNALSVSGVSTITTLQGTTLKNYGETINDIGNTGTAATINLANGNFVTATLTGNCTFTFTTGLSSGAISFTLLLTNDATPSRSIVWPTSVKWPNSSVPVRTTTANATDVYTFFTLNSGTNWYGNLSLYNYT